MMYKKINFRKEIGCIPLLILDHEYGSGTSVRKPNAEELEISQKIQWNKSVCEKVASIGRDVGIDVFWIDPEGEVPLGERTLKANERLRDWKKENAGKTPERFCALISKRFNTLNDLWNENRGGIETIYFNGRNESKSLAMRIQKWLSRGTKFEDRGTRIGNYGIIRDVVDCPSIISEAVFTNLREQEFLMKNEIHQQEIAEKTISAYLEWLGEFKLEEADTGIEEPSWPEPYYEYLNSILRDTPILEKRFNTPVIKGEAIRIIADVTKAMQKNYEEEIKRLDKKIMNLQNQFELSKEIE